MTILEAISFLQISMVVVWVVVIVLALIIEAETVQLVSLWFGIGAIPALICAAFKVPWYYQILIFLLSSAVLLAVTRPIVKKITKGHTLKTNVDQMIDQEGIVTKDIPTDGKGEVKVNFLTWTAISRRNIEIKEGTKVIVQEVKGNKIVVDIIEEIEI